MRFILTFALCLLWGVNVFATAQIPDNILYNGKEYSLHSNPLESFFEKHPDKKPVGGVMSTALWRGYVATFEVRDSQLFLKEINIQYRDTTAEDDYSYKSRNVIDEVFPNQANIKVVWMTGLIVIPHGKLVNYVHMGYGSTYKKYILLEINKGDLVQERRFDYKEYENFKARQFEAFKKTDSYKEIKKELQEDGSTDEFIDSFLRSFVVEYTSTILSD